MRGRIERCWLFCFRVEPDRVRGLVPEPLELVTRGGWAFYNVVVSELSHMRPWFLPRFLGMSYTHVAYRLMVRWQAVEGLYFLRSDVDSSLVAKAGNLLTDFRMHVARVRIGSTPTSIRVEAPGAALEATIFPQGPQLAAGSPFQSIREAEQFLKYKPAALVRSANGVDVLRIGRNEQDWKSRLARVENGRFEFLGEPCPPLELCFEVDTIDYQWNRAERYML
ncbi:MAG TPA: DUF2071 domain-containing protein [Fimbriimonadaceae bacterium]|nr:DUF2071 domain-containing protein [Fimbriimonadaceae bacterium]